MKGLAELTKTTLIGGLLVVLPIYLSILLLAKTLAGHLHVAVAGHGGDPRRCAVPAGHRHRDRAAVCLVAGLWSAPLPACGPRTRSSVRCSRRSPGMRWCGASPNGFPATKAKARSGRRWWKSRTRSRPASSSRSWRTAATRCSCRRCRRPRPARCSFCRANVCIPLDVPFTQAVKVISKWGAGAGALARGISVRS